MKNHVKSSPVLGFEGYYQITIDGRVISLERHILTKKDVRRRIPERVLKAKKHGKGYQFVALCKDGVRNDYYVHRLVASAFIDNPGNLPYLNHLDGNPSNNCVDNLQWVSHKQNVQHGYDTGLNSNKGATHGFAVGVIDNQIGEKFDTVKDWADARGINYSSARNVLNGYSTLKNVDQCLIVKLNMGENETANTK